MKHYERLGSWRELVVSKIDKMFFTHQHKDRATATQAALCTHGLHTSNTVVGTQAYRQTHIGRRKKMVWRRLSAKSVITRSHFYRIMQNLQSTKSNYVKNYISIYSGIPGHLMSAILCWLRAPRIPSVIHALSEFYQVSILTPWCINLYGRYSLWFAIVSSFIYIF